MMTSMMLLQSLHLYVANSNRFLNVIDFNHQNLNDRNIGFKKILSDNH